MDWIPALLKHLGIARSAVAAAFVTSVVLHFGHRVAPNYVDAVPKEWVFPVIATLIFSGFLLVVWWFEDVRRATRKQYFSMSKWFNSLRLNQNEVNFLLVLGDRPSEPLNLENINYAAISNSQLEVLDMVRSLEEKGLVSRNPYNLALVSLTSSGMQRALEIQRASKNIED